MTPARCRARNALTIAHTTGTSVYGSWTTPPKASTGSLHGACRWVVEHLVWGGKWRRLSIPAQRHSDCFRALSWDLSPPVQHSENSDAAPPPQHCATPTSSRWFAGRADGKNKSRLHLPHCYAGSVRKRHFPVRHRLTSVDRMMVLDVDSANMAGAGGKRRSFKHRGSLVWRQPSGIQVAPETNASYTACILLRAFRLSRIPSSVAAAWPRKAAELTCKRFCWTRTCQARIQRTGSIW